MMMVGKRIRERRLALKPRMTQAALAELLEVSPKTVSHWENEERQPDFAMLQKIAHHLKTSMGYLLGETDDPSPPPHPSHNEGVRAGTPYEPESQLRLEQLLREVLEELEEWKKQREQ